MIFKEQTMSTTPNTPEIVTTTPIKDTVFQKKYELTDLQLDLMYYLFNALKWATDIDGFMVIVDSKICKDLPSMTVTSIGESLEVLANKSLIEMKMIPVPKWNFNVGRGFRVTELGLEYQIYRPQEPVNEPTTEETTKPSTDKPTHEQTTEPVESVIDPKDDIIEKLKREIENLKEIAKDKKPQEQKDVELPKSKDVPIPPVDAKKREISPKQPVDTKEEIKPTVEAEKTSSPSIQDIIKKRLKKAKKTNQTASDSGYDFFFQNNFLEFGRIIKDVFGEFGTPICNNVEGYDRETLFYINSYKQVSTINRDWGYRQISNPQHINDFWRWLFLNQDRVADIVDFEMEIM